MHGWRLVFWSGDITAPVTFCGLSTDGFPLFRMREVVLMSILRNSGSMSMIFIVIVLTIVGLSPVASGDSVSVDFSVDLGNANHKASGFIGYIRKDIPLDELMAVKPKYLRDSTAYGWSVAKKCGATVIVVLSLGALHCGYDDNWNGYVNEILMPSINTAKSYKGKQPYKYEIWNEPNHFCWPGGSEQTWFTWWKNIYNIIRQEDPGVDIIGPSYSYYKGYLMKDFLTYCKQNNCLPDVLDWHSWRSYVGDFEEDVNGITQWMANNNIKVNRIINTEYCSRPDEKCRSVGHAVAVFFGPMERCDEVKGALRSIFDWDDGSPSCSYLLTATDHQPTSLWWAYKEYADMEGRLALVTHGKYVDGVAAQDPGKKEIRAIFGQIGSSGQIDVYFNKLNTVSFIAGTSNVYVEVGFLANSASKASDGFVLLDSGNYPVTDSTIHVVLSGVGVGDVVRVRIAPEEPGSAPPLSPQDLRIIND